MEKLYPTYIAYENNYKEPKLCGGKFTSGFDYTICENQTYFSVCTDNEFILIHLVCEKFSKNSSERIQVYFDPKHNSRKFHNARAVSITSEGSATLFDYDYKLNSASSFEGFTCITSCDNDTFICDLKIPFRFLNSEQNPNCEKMEFVGFNVFRVGNGEKSKWSGIPTDFSYFGEEAGGQGNGVLVFAKNVTEGDLEKAAEKFRREITYNYKKWEKTFVPKEIYSLMTKKKRGFTLSVKKDDAKRAKRNSENTEWGAAIKKHILEVADFWTAKSDDYIFDLLAAANPHAATPGQYYGDPVDGGNRTAFQMCLERPYEYYNPTTCQWWYNGKKIINPTTGEIVVFNDDGTGFLSPEGFLHPNIQYMFTAAYRYFAIAALLGLSYAPVLKDKNVCPETTGTKYFHAVTNLAYAYVLTADKQYAYKALIILGRLAEIIPYMNGSHGDGTIADMAKILEPTTTEVFLYVNYFNALDLVYDAIDDVDAQLKECFMRMPDAEGKPRIQTFDIKKSIHELIPHIINLCEINKPVTHDSSVRWINLEMIIASFLESDKLMDRVLYKGEYSFLSKIRNCYYRDGRYAYDSMQYQKLITLEMMLYPNNAYNYQYENGDILNLFEERKVGLLKTVALYFKIICGDLTSAFGDTQVNNKEPLSEERKRGVARYTPAFEIAYMRAGNSAEGKLLKRMISSHLAVYEPHELAAVRIDSFSNTENSDDTIINNTLLLLAVAPDLNEYRNNGAEGRIQPSVLMEDSQTSIFHAGSNARNSKHLIMFAQPTAPHAHGDKLGLWLGAYGYHMLAGGGGYPYTWVAKKLNDWEWHSANCMIVLIDGKTQSKSYSNLKSHYEGENVKYTNMNNNLAYPGCHYERASALVTAPNGFDAYVFDLFYTAGGEFYDYNTSGIDLNYSKIDFDGINENTWTTLKGTMAGEDTELYSAPGYYWMKAVKRAVLEKNSDKVSWSYHFNDATLKLHTFTGECEESLICTLGERGGYEQGRSPWDPYIFHRIETDKPCTFTTILEPYEKSSFVKQINRLTPVSIENKRESKLCFAPVGVEIVYAECEYRDIIIAVHDGNDYAVFKDGTGNKYETDAKFILLRHKKDFLEYVEALSYTYIKANGILVDKKKELNGYGGYKGEISDIDYESGKISIKLDNNYDFDATELERRVAIFSSLDYQKTSSYYIRKPDRIGKELSFICDMSLILKTASWPRGEKNFGNKGKKTVNINGTDEIVDLKAKDQVYIENVGKYNFSYDI